MSQAELTNKLMDLLMSYGLSKENIYLKTSDDEFDTIGFVDADDNGKQYTVTTLITKDSEAAVINVKRNLDKYNENGVLKFLNDLNKFYMTACFYCENGGKTMVLRKDVQGLQCDEELLIDEILEASRRMKEQSVKIDG